MLCFVHHRKAAAAVMCSQFSEPALPAPPLLPAAPRSAQCILPMCDVLIHDRLQGLVAAEEEFSAITDKIPQRPVTVTEAGGYSLVIVAALGVSVADAWQWHHLVLLCPFSSAAIRRRRPIGRLLRLVQLPRWYFLSTAAAVHPNPPWRHSCLAATQFAGAVAYAALNELLFQPKEYQARLGGAAALLGCHLGQCSAPWRLACLLIHIPPVPHTPLTPPARPTSCAPALPLSLAAPARPTPHAQPTPPAQVQHLPVCVPAATFISFAIARPAPPAAVLQPHAGQDQGRPARDRAPG